MVSDLLLADYYKVLHFFRLLSPFKRFRHYMMSWVICRQGWRSAELRNCAFLASDILKVRQIDIFFCNFAIARTPRKCLHRTTHEGFRYNERWSRT